MTYSPIYSVTNEEGFEAHVVAHSVSYGTPEIFTMQLRYPRFIHAELMTHRVFSRNARSSRAVPTERLLTEPPYIPQFAANQKGMQAGEVFNAEDQGAAALIWKEMAEFCQAGARNLYKAKVHKQWANRMLEWFGWIDVVVTSTEWDNFFELRDHPDAQPEFQTLAAMIKEAQQHSSASYLNGDEWHLPYVTGEEKKDSSLHWSTLCKLSAARCARVSYTPFDGNANIEAELERFDKLASSRPIHASPLEHQAQPDCSIDIRFKGNIIRIWTQNGMHRNFTGWVQFRALWEDLGDLLDLRDPRRS